MKLTFKSAASDDIDILFELNKNHVEEYETNLNLDFEKIFEWIKKKIENNIESYQCIYFEGTKVGYYYLHTEGDKLELDDFYIFDEFRGRGIGTTILEHIAAIAEENNKEIFLYVFADNKGAVNLYLRHGYKIIENIDDSRYVMSTQITVCN